MDLNPILQFVIGVAAAAIVPVAALLAGRALRLAQARLHLALSARDQAAVMAAVSTGAGLMRARLATGAISLPDVHLGSAAVDQAASVAMNLITTSASASGLTQEDIAQRIVGSLGHALGEDPTVPSIASLPPPPPAAVAAVVVNEPAAAT
ncbi:hypothetical protein [Rhodopila sp.]|uniref:hypothetical protein n=1 Tax=Rhodopila sp. TaxID=2480087 RepID=UPI003D14BA5B